MKCAGDDEDGKGLNAMRERCSNFGAQTFARNRYLGEEIAKFYVLPYELLLRVVT